MRGGSRCGPDASRAHVPITGGVFNAPGHGQAIGAEAIQVDRHARAGEGVMGLDTFARIVNDERFRGLPLVVETPRPLAEWKKELARLRALVRPLARRRPTRTAARRKRR